MSSDNATSPPPQAGPPSWARRIRSNYFVPRDIVWVRPAKLPYWPAEVLEVDEALNRVKAKLLLPPPAALLEPNLEQERRQWRSEQEKAKQRAQRKKQKQQKEMEKLGEGSPCGGTSKMDSNNSNNNNNSILLEEEDTASTPTPPVEADVVTTNGLRVHFFDKLTTPEELEECMEDRLRRSSHDVSAYEAALYRAVLHANRLVRIVLRPEMLRPYQVCGVGVVHSLMRCHTSAPRQPHTGKFEPQTAVIRLRKGLENAARDLIGFEYIWVLFQFSYAAAMATGVGQSCIQQMQQEQQHDPKAAHPSVQHATTTPSNVSQKIKKNRSKPGLIALGVPPPSSASSSSPADTANTHGSASKEGRDHHAEKRPRQYETTEARGEEKQPPQNEEGAEDENHRKAWDPMRNWRKRQGVANSPGFKTMIVPPRDDELRGVFATRSPHRPNFIGLSCVRLAAVHGLDIHIVDHDLLHGTPVLDIKPYLPFCDAYPNAKAGWVEDLDAKGTGKADHKYDKQVMYVHRIFESDGEEEQEEGGSK